MHDTDTERQSEPTGRRGAAGRRASAGRVRRQQRCGAGPATGPGTCGGAGTGTRAGTGPRTCGESGSGTRTAASVCGVARCLGCGAGARKRGESGAACRPRCRRVAVERGTPGKRRRVTGGRRRGAHHGRATGFGAVVRQRGRGRDFIASAPASPTVTGVEVGAFAGGPEFRTPPALLPLTGTATYRGLVHGFYTAEIGTDGNDAGGGRISTGGGWYCCRLAIGSGNPGSTLAGEFEGSAAFEIRSDSIGSGRPLLQPVVSGYLWPGRFSGVSKDGATGKVTHLTDESMGSGSLFLDGSGLASDFSIDRGTGAVRGETIVFGNLFMHPGRRLPAGSVSGDNAIVERRGAWTAQVNSVLDADGHPRAVAGAIGIEGRTAGNSRHAFIGGFVLPPTGCRGC